tara:strand:- start:2038 stop:2550 length:513 start_codon:yes stop_codon:yes gene_type:complete
MKKILIFLFFIININNCYAESTLAYININYILNNSIVGLSISKHIKEIKENKIKEFKLLEKQLSEKENDIVKKKNLVEKNEFNKQVNVLKEEVNIFINKKKKFNEEIDKKKIKYTKTVLNTLNPIISKYVEDNSILIVFPKKNIIIAKKNLDITEPILNLLNKKLTKIDF